MPTLGRWTYEVDRDATIRAYRGAEGGAETCGCADCRNFLLARANVLPASFLALLGVLGIDQTKDSEIYRSHRSANGLYGYSGWYHFIGACENAAESPFDMHDGVELGSGFFVWLCRPNAPRLEVFRDADRVVQLEFRADAVPWLLQDQAP